jgi:hypothetical protein
MYFHPVNIISQIHRFFLKDNATFAGIFVNNINVANRTESLKEATAKYNAYDSQTWEKEYFDKFSGGFNVYNRHHKFSTVGGGGDAEKTVGKMLAKYGGKQVEFLPESEKKCPDLQFDGQTWDVKFINNANEESIRKDIKNARKADNAIFYWNTNDKLEILLSAFSRELGRMNKLGRIDEMPEVYYMSENGVLKHLPKK